MLRNRARQQALMYLDPNGSVFRISRHAKLRHIESFLFNLGVTRIDLTLLTTVNTTNVAPNAHSVHSVAPPS
jgi:hypothetical protein